MKTLLTLQGTWNTSGNHTIYNYNYTIKIQDGDVTLDKTHHYSNGDKFYNYRLVIFYKDGRYYFSDSEENYSEKEILNISENQFCYTEDDKIYTCTRVS